MLPKEADWPLRKLVMPGTQWTGVLSDPICLTDDFDTSMEARIDALARQMGVEISAPIDTAFWSFAFRNVPGLWPLGWGPDGPVKAKKQRGRPKAFPDDIRGAVGVLIEGGVKKLAIWEELRSQPGFEGRTAAALEAAYYRSIEEPTPATGNRLAAAFALEDARGEGLCLTPDDEITATCLQNWSDWTVLLVTAWPEQQDILLEYRSFRHRPVILSRYIFALRKAV